MTNDSKQTSKKVAVLATSKAELFARLREGLAWEARAEKLMLRYARDVKRPDVIARLQPKIERVQLAKLWLNLACQHASETEARQSYVEAAQPGEEVDES
jgi:hypothetical protein